jgi:hypothetical protein
VFFLMRTEDYRHYGYEVKLSRASNLPSEIFAVIHSHFNFVYNPETRYRLTGVILADLQGDDVHQLDMFGQALCAEKLSKIYEHVELLSGKYGKHTLFLGSSFEAMKGRQHHNERADLALRKTDLFKGENLRKRIGIPMLGSVR